MEDTYVSSPHEEQSTVFTKRTHRPGRREFLELLTGTTGTLIGASVLLQACAGTTASGNASSPITITIMANGGGKDDTGLSDHWMSEFQRLNPTIKLNRLDQDQNRMSAMMAAGTPPDIIRTPGGSEITSLAARGLALDLTSYFARSSLLKPDDLMPVTSLYRWDGRVQGQGAIYGMPHDWSIDSMYWIDTAVFDAAKVPYPSQDTPLTFDELLELGKRVTVRENGKVKVYGLGTNWDYIAQLLMLLAQQGKTIYQNNDLSKLDFTQSEVRNIFQWYVAWAQAHIGDSPLDPGSDWYGPLFMAKRYGMVAAGAWFGGYLESDPSGARKRALLIPTPQWGTEKRVASCYGGTGFWIAKGSKHPDQAWKFFEWFMGGPPAEYRAKSGYGLSPLKHMQSLFPTTPDYNKQAYTVTQAELPYVQTLQFTPYVNTGAISQVIDADLIPAMRGLSTLDVALNQINQGVGALAQQGKQLIG